MKIPGGVLAAAVLLAGCAGGSATRLTPAGTVSSQASAPARTGALLYVSDTVAGDVFVYSYPGGAPVLTLTGLSDPAGECVDAAGNVFVTNTGASNILKYAHGGNGPISTLKDNGYFPVGCAIDPLTGNLAVTNFSTTGSARGNIVIYKGAKGRPTGHFADANIEQMVLCGYDASGNLFADGLTPGSAFAFVELSRGATKLKDVTLNQPIGNGGGVQWDGRHVAVGDQSTSTIYRFNIAGTKGTRVGATSLGGATEIFQFYILGKRVIGPDAGVADVGVWNYPAGGPPIQKITGLYAPLGAVVSKP